MAVWRIATTAVIAGYDLRAKVSVHFVGELPADLYEQHHHPLIAWVCCHPFEETNQGNHQ